MATAILAQAERRTTPTDPTDELKELAATINREHDAGEVAARERFDHYHAAGKALMRVRESLRGGWLKWLRENVRVKRARAYHYIALAKFLVTRNPKPDRLEEEWRRISRNKPKKVKPTKEEGSGANVPGSEEYLGEAFPKAECEALTELLEALRVAWGCTSVNETIAESIRRAHKEVCGG